MPINRPDQPYSAAGYSRAAGIELIRTETTTHAHEAKSLADSSLCLDSLPQWQLACRVVQSKRFAKSELLQRFLLHVCELQLRDRGTEITEQRIGIQIFNRPEGYDPGEDNIVRNYARMLRKRLDAYFTEEGACEPLRITIPRGGYVPHFLASSSVDATAVREAEWAAPDSAVAPPAAPYTSSARRVLFISAQHWHLGIIVLIAFVLGVFTTSWGLPRLKRFRDSQREPAHILWANLFEQNRLTLIVPSDSGVGILQNLAHRLVGIEQYANGSYVNQLQSSNLDTNNFHDLSQQRYTSIVALNAAVWITHLAEFDAKHTQIRYARNLTTDDMKNANVILLGSKHTNPWIELFEERMHFRMEYSPIVDDSYVNNLHPMPGEQSIYRNGANEAGEPTYGVVAYMSGSGGNQVLIVEGLNMAATEAAADTLLSNPEIARILSKARREDGSLRNFEILVENRSVGASAPSARIIASRIDSQ